MLIIAFVVLNNKTIAQPAFFNSNNILLPSNVLVEYSVPLKPCFKMIDGECKDTVQRPFLSNLQQKDIFSIIVKTALSGKTTIYNPDFFNNPYDFYDKRARIDTQTIKNRLGERIEEVMIIDSLGNASTQSITRMFDLSELFALNFIEDWAVTEKPFAMTKTILGTRLVRNYYGNFDNDKVEPSFSFVLGTLDTITKKTDIELSNKRMILTNKIKYEYYLYAENYSLFIRENKIATYNKAQQNSFDYMVVSQNSPFLNSFNIERFVNLIIDNVLKENVPAYDFESNQKLSTEQIKNRLGFRIDTVFTDAPDGEGNTMRIIVRDIDVKEIQSVIFHEEWYIDPETLRMQKKVIGISLVRYSYNVWEGNNSTPIRNVACTIYFDESKKF